MDNKPAALSLVRRFANTEIVLWMKTHIPSDHLQIVEAVSRIPIHRNTADWITSRTGWSKLCSLWKGGWGLRDCRAIWHRKKHRTIWHQDLITDNLVNIFGNRLSFNVSLCPVGHRDEKKKCYWFYCPPPQTILICKKWTRYNFTLTAKYSGKSDLVTQIHQNMVKIGCFGEFSHLSVFEVHFLPCLQSTVPPPNGPNPLKIDIFRFPTCDQWSLLHLCEVWSLRVWIHL